MASIGCQVSLPTYRDSGRTYLIHVSQLSVWDIKPSRVISIVGIMNRSVRTLMTHVDSKQSFLLCLATVPRQ